MRTAASVLKRFASDRSGLAAIELAIIAPVVLLCALSAADLGRFALDKTWVTDAASAGAEYAAAHADDQQFASDIPDRFRLQRRDHDRCEVRRDHRRFGQSDAERVLRLRDDDRRDGFDPGSDMPFGDFDRRDSRRICLGD